MLFDQVKFFQDFVNESYSVPLSCNLQMTPKTLNFQEKPSEVPLSKFEVFLWQYY